MTGEHIAALVHDAALAHQPDLLEAVSAAASVALEQERLKAELEARVVELQASRERIVAASDAERRRLERNLHDGAQQRLVAIALQLRLLQGQVGDPSAEQLVAAVSDQLALSLSELRELARGLHPAVLEHGLAPALESLALRSTVATTVSYEPSERLPEPVELAAYFVASEALANVAKYAAGDERHDARLARRTEWRASRSPTTASAAPHDAARLGAARASPIASRRCRAACAWSARPASARSSPRSCRAGRDRG